MSKRSPRRARGAGPSFPSESDPRSKKMHAAAFEALSLALASADDARLDDARLMEVVPNPDDAHLLAVISAPADACESVREALSEARAYLRREIATEVNRKRAPELGFVVLATIDADAITKTEDEVR
ncbi:hypothetical protein [Sandaracinus amylolyticus]|uniref:hypothetical protein n=1 Tax=Sandaracinus amylolyticus TaxID=927083 RepID=UPI001F4314C8|nr:hypothetical protein [Sandaracinus amylolyticus]